MIQTSKYIIRGGIPYKCSNELYKSVTNNHKRSNYNIFRNEWRPHTCKLFNSMTFCQSLQVSACKYSSTGSNRIDHLGSRRGPQMYVFIGDSTKVDLITEFETSKFTANSGDMILIPPGSNRSLIKIFANPISIDKKTHIITNVFIGPNVPDRLLADYELFDQLCRSNCDLK